MFSPDEKYIITGSGATSKGGKGKLLFLEKNSLDIVKALEVDSTPVKVLWHSKINQVRPSCVVDVQRLICLDRDRFIKWADMCIVLANDIAEWSEAATEQRTTEKGYH
jgi:hypothetical protein